MWKIRNFEGSHTTNYRQYSPTSMTNALKIVRETGAAIRKTARDFGIPEASLRHKFSGRVDPEATRSGPDPILSMEEEARLSNHLKFTASVGYGYSRSEVVDMATEYAIALGKRDEEHPLGFKWYRGFMSRWPELKVLKPRGLEIQRAKATTQEAVNKYYDELLRILEKFNLQDKPERIYNIDEKGLSTSHKAPSVVAGCGTKPPAVTSNTRQNVTIIGCGNALGYSVPPYFVFPGTRMREELLDGKSDGAAGCVTESGWSNGAVFRTYLEDHLLKYLPERDADSPVLILYDGHRSHINIELIEFAKSKHLILFVLPAHTSHVLQPLDIGCFGPLERIYNNMAHKFMRKNCGQSVNRYNICKIACAAYKKALSTENLTSSFEKAGIHPFDRDVVEPSNFQPAQVLEEEVVMPDSTETESNTVQEVPVESNPEQEAPVPSPSTCTNFFANKENAMTKKKPAKKQRRYLSKLVSGKPLTDDAVVDSIIQHQASTSRPAKQAKKSTPVKPSKKAKPAKKSKRPTPIPGPSGDACCAVTQSNSDSSQSLTVDESEKCCKCGRFTPTEVRNSTSLIFVKWVQCEGPGCDHWVHLQYCTSVRVVRRGDSFLCHHCCTE